MFSILLLIGNSIQVKAYYKIKFEFSPAFIYVPLYSTWEWGGGVLPEKFGGGVRPASQNPYSIDHQNLQFSLA